jgi:prepilin-type N-terminal cleavage/methylation domain-containing protein
MKIKIQGLLAKAKDMHRQALKTLSTKQAGFTLLEVLMVIGILAILAGVVLVAINPARQFKIARDSQRSANVTAILSAIGQNMTDHSGSFVCEGQITAIPTTSTTMSANSDGFNIAPCIIPDYISALPYDPSKTGAHFTDETDYSTEYKVMADAEGRVTVSADGEILLKDG